MDILSALDVLRTATDDALKYHTAETILTLKKVGERLNASLLPGIPCDNASEVSALPLSDSIATRSPQSVFTAEASSSPQGVTANESSSRNDCTTKPSSATTRPSMRNDIAPPVTDLPQKKASRGKSRKAPEDLVSKLGGGMKKTTPWIWDINNEDTESIISRKRKPREDRRLEDVRRVEGDPESSGNDKLLRLLAARSFATEFTTEQSRDKSPTRVDELVAYVLSIEPGDNANQQSDASQFRGRGSAVSSFVERLPNISSKPLANRAINSGIKYLVLEKVLRQRLKELGLPELCEAVSAILGLNIQNFRILPYKRMPDFVDVLLSDWMQISLQRDDNLGKYDKRHILDIIRDVTPWFTRLQANYDDFASRTFTPESEPHCAKRTRYNDHTIDYQHVPMCQLNVDISHLTTTEIDQRYTSGGTEMRSDGQFQRSDDVSVSNARSSPNGECLPEKLDVFENFDPFQDLDRFQDFDPFHDLNPLQDFDPFQDLNPLQDFDPFQDLNPLQDFDSVLPDEPPEEIRDTTERLPPDCSGTSQVTSTLPAQDNICQGGTLFLFPSSNISAPQATC